MESLVRWRSLGRVFNAPGEGLLASHAALPVTDSSPDGDVTVYFTSRDADGRSRIFRFDFDPESPRESIRLHREPLIDLGALGAFDDSGCTTSSIVSYGGKKYLYYTGWSLGSSVPFYLAAGVAVGDGHHFEKVSRAPILGRDETDPFLVASPVVSVEDGNWRMWYTSCVRWASEPGGPKHYYHIKHGTSSDGLHWGIDRPVCIDFRDADEYAIARPCVIKEDGRYKMWYSSRGRAYRIGYAESEDGVRWDRLDHLAGVEASDHWDSEMQAYPWVFQHRGREYMLYNGNGYGRSGIGLMVRER